MAMLALRIRLFGPLELAWGNIAFPAPPSPKARSLLAYLIVHHDRAVPRDRLAGIFWPERPDARARRALSNALWRIRCALGPAADRLMAERDTVTFFLHPNDWLDVAEFEEGVDEYMSRRVEDVSSTRSSFTHLLELYRADFLEDIYDDWALLERERLRELYLRALERLITLHKQQTDYEQALTCAQRLAAADPLREAAHRELMRLYHLLGRDRAALEQYATIYQLLEEELGLEPAGATTVLYHEIAAALEEPGVPHLPVPSPPPPALRDIGHLPFIGRDEERAALLDAVQAAAQGHGGIALVEGDAGVGKTRLVGEVAAGVRWRGFQVGLGKAVPDAAPYQPLTEALIPLLPPLRISQLAALVKPLWLSAVTPILPPVAGCLPDLPSLPALKPQREQERLWEGLGHCLSGLATTAPLVLILEDLHWADEATLSALPYLAPRLRESRLLILLTYRSAEARERPIVWETLDALDRALPVQRVRLPPFDAAGTAALVGRALCVTEEMAPFARRLWSETGGNALFLVETLKSLLEQGTLARTEDGIWRFPAPGVPLPPVVSLQAVVSGRLARLSSSERAALELAAVLGEEADFPALSRATAEPAALLPVLEELARRGFLIETEARYRFEHTCIREIVYQTIAPERRRTLHRQVGGVLETLYPERVEPLAHHFSLGEVWDKAAGYNRQAGDRARAVYAGAEAIGYYDRALEAWGHLRSSNESLGLSLYQERGRICQEIGRFDQAEADLQAAYDLAEQVDDKAGQARILNLMSYLQFQRGDFNGAAAVAQQVLNLATAAGLPSEIATGLFNKANALRNLGHYQTAIGFYERAVAMYEELGDQVRLADSLNRMGAAFSHIGAFARARSLMERSLTIRRQLDDRVGISYSLINLATFYCYQGQFARARKAAQEALEIARATGDPYGEDAALLDLGLAVLEQGSPTQAIPFFQRALTIAREIGDQALEPEALSQLGRAYHHLGDLEQARQALEQSLNMVLSGIERRLTPYVRARLARLFLAANRNDEALAHARTGLQAAQQMEDPWSLGLTHRVIGEVAAHLGSERAATEPGPHFEESIRLLREIGGEAELARSLAAYGLYLSRSTGADEAQRGAALLDEARTLFQQLGMARDLARLEAEVAAHLLPGQIRIRLPSASAPTGRPLRDDEWVEVTWTVTAPGDDEVTGKVARRRQRILRLLREAQEQSAAPTVDDLAAALGVGERTIERDLAALRAAGHDVRTRGARA